MNCFSLTPKFSTVFRILSIFAFALIWTISPALSRMAQAQPAFSTSFSPNSIGPGGTTTLTYTIDNTSSATGVTDMAFINTLPAGVTLATPASASTSCVGSSAATATLSAPDGGATFGFSEGRLAGLASCTVSVNVTSSVAATYTNTTGDLTSSAGNSGAASSNLTIVTTRASFTKAFVPSTINQNGISTLTYTIDNSSNANPIGNLDFTEVLPTGLVVASPSNATTNCIAATAPNTILTAVSGSSTITLDANGNTFFPGFEVTPAGGTCTVSLNVQGAGVGTFTATSGDLLTDFTSVGPSTATLTVIGGDLVMSKSFTDDPVTAGATVTLDYTLRNNDRNFAASAVAFSDDLNAALAGLTLDSVASNTCGGTVSGAGTTSVSFSGGSIAAQSDCMISLSLPVPAGAVTGGYPSTSSAVTATVNGTSVTGTTASDTLSVQGVTQSPPTLAVTFGDAVPGGPSSGTFVLTNTATVGASDVTAVVEISPPLPFPVTLTPGANGCGGAFSTVSTGFDQQGIQLAGGVLNASGTAGDSCTVNFDITVPSGVSPGVLSFTSQAPSATVGGVTATGSATSATMTIGGGVAVDLIKAFDATDAQVGGTVGLTFTITNRAESAGTATDISFTDDLGAFSTGTVLTSVGANDCGVTPTGTGTISVSGVSLGLGASCSIATTLTLGTDTGSLTNTTSAPTAGLNGGPTDVAGAVATANLTVNAFQPVTLTHEFVADPYLAGDAGVLRYTINNPNTNDATSLIFTHNLSSITTGLTATAPLPSNPCGVGSTLSGTTFMILVGGQVTGGNNCTFDVPILVPAGATDGTFSSVTSNLTGTLDGASRTFATSSSTLTVENAALRFSKAFASDSAFAGSVVELTFDIENSASSALTALAFTDDLENNFLSGTTFLGQNSNSCTGGTLSGQGTGVLAFSGGTLAANASCSISVNVQLPAGATAADYTNTTSTVTAVAGVAMVTGNVATDDLTVFDAAAPTFSKSFDGPTTATGTAQLSFTITNPSTTLPISDLAFTDDLGAMLSGATASGLPANPCGASSSLSGSSVLTFSAGTIAPLGSCTFSVTVQIPASATAGSYTNTTSDLTRNGLTITSAATAGLTIESPPGFAKAFTPASIAQGATSTLTFTVDNTGSSVAASSLAFADTLPTGVTVAATPSVSSTCGTVSASANSGTISLSGGNVAAGASCTVAVDVTSSTVGAAVNTTGDLTSSAGNSGTASATLTVTAAPAPSFSKAFGAGAFEQGGSTSLTFTIDNTAALIDATALAFTDTLPTGMTVATPPNSSSTCGAISAGAGSGSISLSGGTVTAGASCTIAVDVTSSTIGAANNVSGALTSSAGNSGTATASVTVSAAPVPGFAKAFGSGSIVQGGVDTVTFTIDNTALIAANSLAFNDTFPSGMTVAATPNSSSTCTGGAITATAGSASMSYSGGSVAAGSSCTVSFDVTSASVGAVTNTSSTLVSGLGTSPAASANFSVTAAPTPGFSKAFGPSSIVQGGVTTLTFSIDNSGALVSATALDFTDPLPTGMTVAGTPNASTTCTGGTLTAAAGAGTIGYTGGTAAQSASCTVSVDVTSATQGVVTNTTGNLTSDLGNSGTANASLSVTATPVPTFSKAFGAASLVQGATTTLTFTVDNTASLIDATSLAFSDTFPSGMTVAATPNSSSTCTGGAITATAGAGVTSYAGGTVAAGGSCTISVDVTAVEVGNAVNVSAALNSSSGTSGTATDTLTVTAASAPGFAKAFTPASIEQGATSTLTFTIDNSAPLVAATSLDFSDTFPTGMTVAAIPNASTTCTGGTITATAGAGLASYTGGSVAATSTCTVSMDVTSTTVGAAANTSGALTSSQGSSGTASATLTVTAATAPTFSKAFSPSTIVQGSTSTLTYTIDNSTVLIEATSLDFSDTFPSGMTLASSPNASTTCTGGTLSATAGSSGFGYTGGTVALGDSCTVSVDVNSVTVGAGVSTTGDLTSSLGNSGTASATLTVTGAPAPTFTKAFSPASILSGGTSRVIFTINNAAALVPATSLSFIDNFPAAIQVAATPNVSSTCGGTFLAPSGSTRVNLSVGSLVAGGSCTVAVNVTATGTGPVVSTSNALTSSLGNSGTASATLTLSALTTGQVTITQLSDVNQDFSFTSAEALLNFTISTLSGGGTQGPITLAAGSYSMSQIRPAGFGNTSITCSDSNSVGISSSGALTLNVEVGESVACTFASVDSVTPTREAINDFLTGRINQILSNEPSNGRRINRLKRGFGGSRSVSFTRGNLSSLSPVNFDLKSMGSGSYSISGSLAQAQAAIARHPLSLDGSETDTTRVDNHRFDVWFEASYSRFEGSQGSEGHFGIGYLGADFLVNQDLLVGFLVQYDDTEDRSVTLNRVASGEGWMAGPYVTARLSENLYFDGRIAVGRSKNFLNLDLNGTTGLANGRFSTSRWLIDASLVGDFEVGKWQMQPDISLAYMEETQKAFVDSLNVLQPEQTVSQGQLRFGPNFSRRFDGQNGVTYEPSFSVDGIYNFGNSGSGSPTATANDTKGARARVEAGLGIADRNGTNLNLNVHYDGIGQTNYESYGISLKLEMKF